MRLSVAVAGVSVLVASVATSIAWAGAGSRAASLHGTYIRTVTKTDITRTSSFRREGPGETPPPTGHVKLVLAKHTFRFVDPTGFAISQTYTATARGRLNINTYRNPAKGSFCGPTIPQNATYHWALKGKTLVLKAIGDRCADRDSVLTGRWTRVAG